MAEIVLNKFSGINFDANRGAMSQDWLSDLYNGYLLRTGDHDIIKQRGGTLNSVTVTSGTIGAATRGYTHLFEALWSSSNAKEYFSMNGANTYRGNQSGSEATHFFSTNSLDDHVDAGNIFGGFTMFNDNLIFVNSVKEVQKTNSSYTVSALSSDSNEPTSLVSVHTHNHRLILGTDAGIVRMSRVDDVTSATAWSQSNDHVTINLTKQLNEFPYILGFKTVGKSLLVIFTTKAILIYDVPTIYENIRLIQTIKTTVISRSAFGQVGNSIIFPGKEGLKILSPSGDLFSVEVLPWEIKDYYRKLIDSAGLSNSRESFVSGVYYAKRNLYLLSIGGRSGEPEDAITIVYSLNHSNAVGRWRLHSSTDTLAGTPSCWLETSNGQLFYGTHYGNIYKYDESDTDDGTGGDIPFAVEYAGLTSTGDYFNKKSLKNVIALIEVNKDTTVRFKYRADNGTETNFTQTVSQNNVSDPQSLTIALNSGTPLTEIDIDATSIFLDGHQFTSVNLTLSITTSGANGLDTGSRATGAVYNLFIIYSTRADTLASLMSIQNHPELPQFYDIYRFIGSVQLLDASPFNIDTLSNRDSTDAFVNQPLEFPTLVEDTNPTGRGNFISLRIEQGTQDSLISIHGVRATINEEGDK